jgi:hypothetical protein
MAPAPQEAALGVRLTSRAVGATPTRGVGGGALAASTHPAHDLVGRAKSPAPLGLETEESLRTPSALRRRLSPFAS